MNKGLDTFLAQSLDVQAHHPLWQGQKPPGRLQVTKSVWPRSDDHMATLEESAGQQALRKLKRGERRGESSLSRQSGPLRMASGLSDEGKIAHSVNLVQSVQQEENSTRPGFPRENFQQLFVLVHLSLFVSCHTRGIPEFFLLILVQVDFALHVFQELRHELPAGHGPQPVECAALDEDEGVKVGGPQLAAAPLHAHVLEHRALADARGRLDGDHRRQRRAGAGHGPARAEHGLDPHGLDGTLDVPVLGEVVGHLGPVVHVEAGGLLGVHLREDELLVEVLLPRAPPLGLAARGRLRTGLEPVGKVLSVVLLQGVGEGGERLLGDGSGCGGDGGAVEGGVEAVGRVDGDLGLAVGVGVDGDQVVGVLLQAELAALAQGLEV